MGFSIIAVHTKISVKTRNKKSANRKQTLFHFSTFVCVQILINLKGYMKKNPTYLDAKLLNEPEMTLHIDHQSIPYHALHLFLLSKAYTHRHRSNLQRQT